VLVVAVARTQARETCVALSAESHVNGMTMQLAVGTPLSHCFLTLLQQWHTSLSHGTAAMSEKCDVDDKSILRLWHSVPVAL